MFPCPKFSLYQHHSFLWEFRPQIGHIQLGDHQLILPSVFHLFFEVAPLAVPSSSECHPFQTSNPNVIERHDVLESHKPALPVVHYDIFLQSLCKTTSRVRLPQYNMASIVLEEFLMLIFLVPSSTQVCITRPSMLFLPSLF